MCGSALKQRSDGHLTCTACPFVNYRNPRPTVTGLALHHGMLLLTKRAHPPFKGWWDLPGGFMEKNETPEHALLRELKEETGLEVRIRKLLGIYTDTYRSLHESFPVLSIAYVVITAKRTAGAFDDVVKSKWVPLDQIPHAIAFASNREILRDFFKHKRA